MWGKVSCLAKLHDTTKSNARNLKVLLPFYFRLKIQRISACPIETDGYYNNKRRIEMHQSRFEFPQPTTSRVNTTA